MQVFVRVLIPAILLALGWLGLRGLSKEEERGKRPERVPQPVRTKVVEVSRRDYPTQIHSQGVVRAHNPSSLTAEIPGKVVWISDRLQDGGFFDKTMVLVRLDDLDYRTAVASADAALARASAVLSQEEARAKQARLNWEDLGYDEEPNELVLRLPQLREAQANVKAAEVSLEQAERDLQRTEVYPPFDGRVLAKTVAVGQSITPATSLAGIFSTDFVEVRLPISARHMGFLTLPERTGDGEVEVNLTDMLTDGSTASWTGKIVGTEGALDPDSRELFAIARVNDPFGILVTNAAERGPQLRVGQPVVAEIKGIVLKDVLAIPRQAARQPNRIFLVSPKDDYLVLDPRDIAPIWSDTEYHVIRDDSIADGTKVAMTRLVYGPREARVEILPDEEPVPEETAAEGESTAATP